jgi:DNA-binding CsgD family transcriptional regulator
MISCTSIPPNNGGTAQYMAKGCESKEDLIRRLVGTLGKVEPVLEACKDCTAEEIILDTNVDGIRYLLIRMPVPMPAHVSLSPREQEIVRMVAKGYSTKAIARVLNISCWTVSAHLRRVFTKLGVTSRLAMVGRLQEEGRKWTIAGFTAAVLCLGAAFDDQHLRLIAAPDDVVLSEPDDDGDIRSPWPSPNRAWQT